MRRLGLVVMLFAALTSGGLFAPAADAQFPLGWGFYPNRNGYSDLALPYFSQFPPVYYSHPVPRPYGWSPYAYPPTVLTPDFAEVEPAEMINPFVDPQEAEELPEAPQPETQLAPERSVRRPQMIVNPYVTQEELVTLE